MIRAEQHILVASSEYFEAVEDILWFVTRHHAAGAACALAVITKFTGGSSRSTGSLFAVAGDGSMAGYVSNGCIDADVRLQAVAALGDGKVRLLISGMDSPFIDLRLPCGGSVENLIDPRPAADVCRDAVQVLHQRQPVTLGFDQIGGLTDAAGNRDALRVRYLPRLRLAFAGRGARSKNWHGCCPLWISRR